jgi:hypothetical protein
MLLGGGENMVPIECFREAKKIKGINYVGLQNGGECWAGKTYGKYNIAKNNRECNMICTEDPEI